MFQVESSKLNHKPFSCRLVKGAFLNAEKAKSNQKQKISPVCGTFRYTQQNMTESISYILKNMTPNSHLNIATSNKDCVSLCIQLSKQLNLNKNSISFCQFRGMGDNITELTLNQGYISYKQIPYGPLHQMLPYIIKRSEETHDSIKASTVDQIKIIKKELFNERKLHIKVGIGCGLLVAIMIGLIA